MKRIALLLVAALLLPGCGLRPLYAGGGQGVVARTLGQVEVAPIGGRTGWLLRNALTDRLTQGGPQTPVYRLEVELDDDIIGLGVRRDTSITRERRTLRARYKLVEAGEGTVLLDATAGADAGIDVVSSDYATVAAEQTALDNLVQSVSNQIVARLGLYASRTAER